MPLIAHPLGDFDEYFILKDIYKPDGFQEGWYFLPYNFPNYQLISTDIDPDVDEVIVVDDKLYVEGFTPLNMHYPSGSPVPITRTVFHHYPSGVPYRDEILYYWELNSDINNPYLFVPYFDPNTYGEIVWLELDQPLEILTTNLIVKETLLNGLIVPFKEKIVSDANWTLPLKEKVISLLTCDMTLVTKSRLKLTWKGERVPWIEILRKGISDKEYGNPIAVVPFDDGQFTFELDNNSYIFTVRGANGTGSSNTEITVGVRGKTNINSTINLGDFVKLFEVDLQMTDTYEAEILI